jgi:hypothetical protein
MWLRMVAVAVREFTARQLLQCDFLKLLGRRVAQLAGRSGERRRRFAGELLCLLWCSRVVDQK